MRMPTESRTDRAIVGEMTALPLARLFFKINASGDNRRNGATAASSSDRGEVLIHLISLRKTKTERKFKTMPAANTKTINPFSTGLVKKAVFRNGNSSPPATHTKARNKIIRAM